MSSRALAEPNREAIGCEAYDPGPRSVDTLSPQLPAYAKASAGRELLIGRRSFSEGGWVPAR